MNRPLVSLCLFTYNQEKYIDDAIDGALAQTYQPLEIIISDDHSKDNTYQIIQEKALKYTGPHKITVRQNKRNIGLVPHVNEILLKYTKGKYVALAAGDDISLPERITKCVDILTTNPELMALSCGLEYIDDNGITIKDINYEYNCKIYDLKDYINENRIHINGASRILNWEVIKTFGKLNDNCPTEDTTFLLRAIMKGQIIQIPDKLVKYRWHSNNLSSSQNIHKLKTSKIYNQYIKDIGFAHRNSIISNENKLSLIKICKTYRKSRLAEEKRHNHQNTVITKLKNTLKNILKKDKTKNIWWWQADSHCNFGDELTPYIITKLFDVKIHKAYNETLYLNSKEKIISLFYRSLKKIGIPIVYRPKVYFIIGSIIRFATPNSIIWGSGIIARNDIVEQSKVLAVRGYETIKRLKELRIKAPNVVGDPALLLPLTYKPTNSLKKYKLGIIPHYVDYKLVQDVIIEKDILVIDLATNNIEDVIEKIYSCEFTISSSLHGLIVSQAYNIPSLWFQFSNNLSGDNIKFYDYFSSVDINYYDPFTMDQIPDLNSVSAFFDRYKSINQINNNLLTIQKELLKAAPFPKKH